MGIVAEGWRGGEGEWRMMKEGGGRREDRGGRERDEERGSSS